MRGRSFVEHRTFHEMSKRCSECGKFHSFSTILICAGCFSAPPDYGTCSHCGGILDRENQSWCRTCHNEYQRLWRLANPGPFCLLSPEEQQKVRCRERSQWLQKRGSLSPQPCCGCGYDGAEKHHPDYDDPYYVVWLCPNCHRNYHKESGK